MTLHLCCLTLLPFQAGLNEDHSYHTQILEYSQGELYQKHEDCNNAANDRAGTSLMFLTDVEDGGETGFPRLGIKVKARKGTAVFFGSLDSEGRCDKLTQHVGEKVNVGTKTVLQRWYYQELLVRTTAALSD